MSNYCLRNEKHIEQSEKERADPNLVLDCEECGGGGFQSRVDL
jgi:hypothetical protein